MLKAEAGGLEKSVDLLVSRFRLHQVLASHGKAQVKSPPPNSYPHRSPGPKVKEGDVLMLQRPWCCEHAQLWEVGENGELPAFQRRSRPASSSRAALLRDRLPGGWGPHRLVWSYDFMIYLFIISLFNLPEVQEKVLEF